MRSILFLLIISILLISCEKNNKEERTPVQRNVIILLDLSDRIILNTKQPSSDKETISAIVDAYISSIKDTIVQYDKDFSLIKDKFAIRIADQKGTKIDKNNFEQELQFDFSNTKTDNVKYILKDFKSTLQKQLDKLYSLASQSNNPKDYHGADIWKFFNEDLENLLSKDPNSQNYLFIITDGYLYFENYNKQLQNTNRRTDMKFLSELRNKDWESKFDEQDMGLIPVDKNYSNLKVAVLGIAPKDFWNEFDLIKKVWGKWFKEMGLAEDKIIFFKSENTTIIENKVKEFIK